MYSSSVLVPLNIAIIPAAYLYGAGFSFYGLIDQLQQWRNPETPGAPVIDPSNYICQHPAQMRPKFLAYDPVMVYIEGFLTDLESDYLKSLAYVSDGE